MLRWWSVADRIALLLLAPLVWSVGALLRSNYIDLNSTHRRRGCQDSTSGQSLTAQSTFLGLLPSL